MATNGSVDLVFFSSWKRDLLAKTSNCHFSFRCNRLHLYRENFVFVVGIYNFFFSHRYGPRQKPIEQFLQGYISKDHRGWLAQSHVNCRSMMRKIALKSVDLHTKCQSKSERKICSLLSVNIC